MTDKQLTFGDDEIMQLLNRVYLHFKEGQFSVSIPLLERALTIDFEYPGISAALKCARFWEEREKSFEHVPQTYEAGEYIFSQWRQFLTFVSGVEDMNERCVYNIRHYIFGTALRLLMALYNESQMTNAAVLLKIGRCFKRE